MTQETSKPLQVGKTILKRRLKWIGLVSLLPIFILFVFFAFIVYRESVASSDLKQKLADMRQSGEPYDNDSMAKFFEKLSHKEGTSAWSEVLAMGKASTAVLPPSTDLPIVGARLLPFDLRPGSEWPDEPRVAEFLQEIRPIIKRIQMAGEFPKPVWMPIKFDGFLTLLEPVQESRNLARILELDAVHALYQKEGERALHDIVAMGCVADAFDWRFCTVGNLVSFAIHGMQVGTINRSLGMDVWSEEQLLALSAQVDRPYDVAKAWNAASSGERAMANTSLDNLQSLGSPEFRDNPFFKLPVLPSTKLAVLRAYEEWQHCADAGESRLGERAHQVASTMFANGVFRISDMYLVNLMPGIESYAFAFHRKEMFRRLTYTSLAVKRFQMKNKRWPKRLSELSDVGLLLDDWTTSNHQTFGYEVENDGAYVWSYEPGNRKDVSATRPVIDPNSPEVTLSYMVAIR